MNIKKKLSAVNEHENDNTMNDAKVRAVAVLASHNSEEDEQGGESDSDVDSLDSAMLGLG